MEQWRAESSTFEKRKLMCMASVALGACGIWSMHFVGMNALQLAADGVKLEMYFEPVLTFISLLSAFFSVFVGLHIASKDPFFVNIQESRRSNLLTATFKKENMAITNKKEIRKKMQVRIFWNGEIGYSFLLVYWHV